MSASFLQSWKGRGRVWLLPALYCLVAVMTLGANPFRQQTITPVDILVSQRAWAFVDPGVKVRNFQRSDTLNWLLPQWSEGRRQLREGHWPVWDDKIAGGGSLLTLSSTLFTPAFLIFSMAPDPAMGFYAAIIFNLTFAGLGMHLLLRRRVGWLATVVGAVTFELCGFNAAWLYWPHVFTLMWAPWLLLAVDRCAQRPCFSRALGVSVASALALLGGFPFVTLLVFAMAALYALVLFAYRWRNHDQPWDFAAWYVAGTLLGILLCAIPLLGLVSWLHQYDISYRYGRGSYLDFHQVKQLFPPWAWEVRRVEQTMYVGATMMTMALLALVRLGIRWRRLDATSLFVLILLPVSAGLVFGLWPMWLIGWIPGMAYNSWSRAIGVMDIALIILGALCIDHFWKSDWAGRLKWIRPALMVIALLQVAEISLFFRSYNGPASSRYYYPPTPTIDYMREHAGPFDYVITDRSFVMSGTLGVYGMREWLAHYFRSPALQSVLHRMAKHPFNSHRASASRFPASDIKYESEAMAAYNVRFAAIDSRQHPTRAGSQFRRVFEAAGTAVYENGQSPNGPYFLADMSHIPDARSGQEIRVDRYRPDSFELRYEGTDAGYVIVPMSTTPDWLVTVNGKPQSPPLKDGVLPAVKVDGPATIDFTYSPRVLHWFYPWLAALIAAITLMFSADKWTGPRPGQGTHNMATKIGLKDHAELHQGL
jgi:hypothetical protein